MKLTIDYEPTPKGVARSMFLNGKVRTYYHWKTTEALKAIRALIIDMNLKPFSPHIPIRMEVTFYRTQPKWSLKREKLPCRKPDNANYTKLIEDCISPILVPDDAQFTTTLARKRWSQNGHGYIVVELTEDKL